MNESCVCIEVDDHPQFSSIGEPKANKVHICCECNGDIAPGERYERATLLYDGHWNTYKTCKICLRIRKDWFQCGWYYGMMHELLLEETGIDYLDASNCDDDE